MIEDKRPETVTYETHWGSFTLIVNKEFDANTPLLSLKIES